MLTSTREICKQADHDHNLAFDDVRIICRRFIIMLPLLVIVFLLAIYSESSSETTIEQVINTIDSVDDIIPSKELQNNNVSNTIDFVDDITGIPSNELQNNNVSNVSTIIAIVKLNITDKYIRFLDRNITAEDWQLLQNTRDHWSHAGKWIAGDNDIQYDMTFPVPTLVSYGCEHYELKKASIPTYKWVVDHTTGHSSPPFPTQYSKHRLCSVLGGQRILLVGDSLQEHFYFYFGLIATQNLSMASIAAITGEMSINCTEHGFLPVELYFIRSDRLFIGDVSNEEATNYTNYVDHSFIQGIQQKDITLLLLNRGAHYVKDINLLRNLDLLFRHLLKTYENISIVFRNTSPGHPDCNNQLYSPPLLEPPDLQTNRGPEHIDSAHRYHWTEFVHQNSLVQNLIAEQYPSILLLDIATPTILRADHHVGGEDCLHYCCHSVVDHWLLLFINVLEQVQMVGKQ